MSAKRGGLGTNLDSLIPTSLTVGNTEVAQQNEVLISAISPTLASLEETLTKMHSMS